MRALRRTPTRAVLLALVMLAISFRADAAPANFIWKATNASGKVIYLAGSIHLLSPDFYPLAAPFEQAFDSSDTLVEELDMGEMLSPDAQMMMVMRGMLPAGQTLDKVVSAKTLALVKGAVDELGIPLLPLTQFKPWMLAITLQSIEWEKAGFDANLGLDKHFYDKAVATGKRVQGLETLDYQISRFDGMTPDAQDRLLAETVTELASTQEMLTNVADAWKSGNTARLEQLVLDDLKSEPELYERLLADRNANWLPKIEALFAAPRPSLIVVGAAHLIGPDGLLQALRNKGYTITPL
ncbi:MAG: TraB/GumN family protein [Acidobacteriaceae bacterium]|jgi:uncharacterized protein YbaP (TraB family)|nr:TraB/GumN family protein [Acidobacteriaceae bacterium]